MLDADWHALEGEDSTYVHCRGDYVVLRIRDASSTSCGVVIPTRAVCTSGGLSHEDLNLLFEHQVSVSPTVIETKMTIRVKFTGLHPMTVTYRDRAHLDTSRDAARTQHLKWMDDPDHSPLDFEMRWADFELDDFAHGCSWNADSARCFREMLLLPTRDEDDDAGWACASGLHVTIKAALRAVLPLLPKTAHTKWTALDVPILRDTAHTAIETWFEWWWHCAEETDAE